MNVLLHHLGFANSDPKLRRVVRYWALTVALYALCIGALWVEALSGTAKIRDAIAVTVLGASGQFAFYVLIQMGGRFKIAPATLSEYQGRFAVVCGVLGYSVIGPFRGTTLTFFVVILVFCAFTLPAAKSRHLAVFAVTLLGMTMAGMALLDPAVDGVGELKNFVMVSSAILVVGYLTGRLSELREMLNAQKLELKQALRKIQELADHDGLTGLPNRRKMSELLLEQDIDKADRVCLALLDIDHFKDVNDNYGHAAGDHVLQDFAQRVCAVIRPQDILSRWGGEEFLLYLPGTTLEIAKGVIERLREQVSNQLFLEGDREVHVTCSVGLVAVGVKESVDEAISRADSLLYRAKRNGRNRVEW